MLWWSTELNKINGIPGIQSGLQLGHMIHDVAHISMVIVVIYDVVDSALGWKRERLKISQVALFAKRI